MCRYPALAMAGLMMLTRGWDLELGLLVPYLGLVPRVAHFDLCLPMDLLSWHSLYNSWIFDGFAAKL